MNEISPAGSATPETGAPSVDMARLEAQVREAVRREDWERALGLYAAIRAHCPDQAAASLGYGNCLLHLERGMDEARQTFAEAARRFPENRQAEERLAHIAARQGDFETALRRYAAVCRRYPDYAGGLLGYADILGTVGRVDEAEAMVQDFVQRHPDNAGAWHRLIHFAQSRGQLEHMLARAQEGVRRFPEDVYKHYAIVRAFIAQFRFDKAAAILETIQTRFPEAPIWLVGKLWLAGLKRAPDKAAALYGDIRRRFPDNLDGPMHYARLLLRLEAFQAAEAVLSELVESFPNRSGPWLARAQLAAAEGDKDQVLERFRQAASRFPDNYAAQSGYGRALLETGDQEAALAFYHGLRLHFPFRPGPSLHFARLACLAGRDDEAVEGLRRLRACFPNGYPGQFASGGYTPVRCGFDPEEVLFSVLADRFPDRLDLQLGFARMLR